jgi:tetratricopeptide (TPR) repeat protein
LIRFLIAIPPAGSFRVARCANLWYADEAWDKSARDFARGIDLETPSKNLLMGYASALRHAERFDAALEVYEACLQDQPELEDALLGRARVLADRGNSAEAAPSLRSSGADPEAHGP